MLRRYASLALLFALAACSSSEQAVAPPPAPAPEASPLDRALAAEPLGLDPAVRVGTLENGLTYYVRANAEPQDRAELRLVVNAGSVLEDEDQQGLAHFVEHMAFNGTERFPENELISYLESLGIQFGADQNAYTSFDETVYLLQVPTDTAGVLDTGLNVLSEWAGHIAFADSSVERERGVVLEEWRGRRGAQARVNDELLPVLLGASRYAERLPIGEPEILQNAPPATLRRYYETWYRPDLMAVVAVGDFDADAVEAEIRARFGRLASPAAPRARETFEVPAHDETRFVITTDPELSQTGVTVYYKEPAADVQTVGDYRDILVQRLFNRMLNARLYERTQQADPPYIGAFVGKGGLVRPVDMYVVQAVVEDGGVPEGLDAVLTEVARVRQHGFTASELERTQADLLRELEVAFNERDKTNSAGLANELVGLFLEGEPAPSIGRVYELAQMLLPTIGLVEIDALADQVTGEGDRVIAVTAPEKQGVPVPTEAELRAVFGSVAAKTIEPYDDSVSAAPLIANPPAPGAITSISVYEDGTGIIEYTLDNGARVVLKPTDFKNDEVLFTAFSPGGTSLVDDAAFRSAQQAATAVGAGGLGAFSAVELDKKLAGQAVQINPYIDERDEGLVGSASPADLETLFQLIHLHFTAPRADPEAFGALMQRYAGLIANRSARPESAFSDTLQVTLAQNHPRRQPFTVETLDEIDLDTALSVYRDRFADASDFTFVFVGAFAPQAVQPLVEQYLATLPATGRAETARDLGIRAPAGAVEKVVRRGIEPKAQVQLVFPGTLDARIDTLAIDDEIEIDGELVPVADSVWAARHAAARAERYLLSAFSDALSIRLREVLREDRGGVYGVGVTARANRDRGAYSISIGFGCDPERVDELIGAVFDELVRFQDEGPLDDTWQKVKEADRRGQQVRMRENGAWLSAIASAYRYGDDPLRAIDRTDLIDDLSYGALRGAAQFYLDLDRYVQVVLLPEAAPGNGE